MKLRFLSFALAASAVVCSLNSFDFKQTLTSAFCKYPEPFDTLSQNKRDLVDALARAKGGKSFYEKIKNSDGSYLEIKYTSPAPDGLVWKAKRRIGNIGRDYPKATLAAFCYAGATLAQALALTGSAQGKMGTAALGAFVLPGAKWLAKQFLVVAAAQAANAIGGIPGGLLKMIVGSRSSSSRQG